MNRYRRIGILGVIAAAVLPALAFGQTEYYYNGPRRVDIEIARDELAVPPIPGRRLPLQSLALTAPGGKIDELPSGGALIRFQSPAADLPALAARARAVRASGGAAEAVVYPAKTPPDPSLRATISNRFSVKLKDGAGISEVARAYGFRIVEAVEFVPDAYIAEAESDELLAGLTLANDLFESGLAEFATPLVSSQQQTRFVPNDALFSNQWHLRNTGQVSGSIPGEDVNVVGAWDLVRGAGVNIAITDTGVVVNHQDLAPNARTDIDIDFNGGDDDPTPAPGVGGNNHGTGAAGIAAARGNNAIGVSGAAPEAGIVGIRLIDGNSTDQTEADAMNHQVAAVSPSNYVHVNSNSWGPSDCGCILGDFGGPLMEAALANGVANGRGGKGTVYVWAGGNGRQSADNVNYDAYASSRYTIAVGASGADGTVSYYSERGASLLVNSSSSYTGAGTTTTWFPNGNPGVTNNYTSAFSGTSSAAPLVAGIVALMLEANPNLGWRDVQHILVETSEKNAPGAGWNANGTGRLFNLDYGFGRADATAAVLRALDWTPVPANATPINASKTVNTPIPDNNSTGVISTITISGAPADFFIEHVEITLNATHTDRGDLFVILKSPTDSQSVLATVHGDTGDNYNDWKFTSVAHWGENPNGAWQLTVKDLAPGMLGGFNNWNIRFHGFLKDFGNVFVDPAYGGIEEGTANLPYNTLPEGITNVTTGGTLHVKGGIYTTTTLTKPMTIVTSGNSVTLRAP